MLRSHQRTQIQTKSVRENLRICGLISFSFFRLPSFLSVSFASFPSSSRPIFLKLHTEKCADRNFLRDRSKAAEVAEAGHVGGFDAG